MQPYTQIPALLTALAAMLLTCKPALADCPQAPKLTVCADSAASVPAEYWFYHALAAAHPSLLNSFTGSSSCSVRKVIRT